MKTEIVYTNKALKDIDKLDITTARQIVKKIGFYSKKDNPLLFAKKLKPPFDDLFRFRIGDYRVIFEVDNKGNMIILTVLTVKHRKDVYS